jgi:hypothetical protein
MISKMIPAPDQPYSGGDVITSKGYSKSYLQIGEQQVITVGRGQWIVRAWHESHALLFGQVQVSVTDGIADVVVQLDTPYDWQRYAIVDQTGVCSAKGTMFAMGLSTLADMRDAHAEAREFAKMMAKGVPERLTSRTPGAIVAQVPGFVQLPSWIHGRVAVMPDDGSGLFEGEVALERREVIVRAPSWGATVTFAPMPDATLEQTACLAESGWFVAIREYHDVQDLKRIEGLDFKIPASDGVAVFRYLPNGTYAARYIRAGQEESRDPATGNIQRRVVLEWFDAVRFDVQQATANVALPTERN